MRWGFNFTPWQSKILNELIYLLWFLKLQTNPTTSLTFPSVIFLYTETSDARLGETKSEHSNFIKTVSMNATSNMAHRLKAAIYRFEEVAHEFEGWENELS